MRYMLASVACAAVLSFAISGCDNRRQNMAIVPDREGHAYGAEGTVQPIVDAPVAGPGEMYHTLEPNESLASVARKFNIDLGWLIKRNDIQDETKVRPGLQLIVPRIQMAPAMPQQEQPAAQPQPAPRASTPSSTSTRPSTSTKSTTKRR
jgi:hypothetical protein